MRLTEAVHDLLAETLRKGDRAVDATAGNGRDTVHMARLVGPAGRVVAIDRQAIALVRTQRRLADWNLGERARLVRASHHRMARFIPTPVRAAVFNLGYLPGGDRRLITRPDTTLPALDAAARLLEPGGLLTILAYTGHSGGMAEADAIERWIATGAQGLEHRSCDRFDAPPGATRWYILTRG